MLESRGVFGRGAELGLVEPSGIPGLLAETGFGDLAVTGDYQDARAPGPGNQVWTFHAVRPGGPDS